MYVQLLINGLLSFPSINRKLLADREDKLIGCNCCDTRIARQCRVAKIQKESKVSTGDVYPK